MSSNPNLNFPGYTVLEQLGETHASSVYRACKSGEHKTVIIKVIRIKVTSPEMIARFRHEYELIKRIDVDGIVKPIDFFSYEGSPALVLEDFGGVSLKSLIENGFTTERFLTIAIRIAEILGMLHQLQITHRDIKPHNIIINPDTGILKITDFGISVARGQDQHEINHPSAVSGTLAYISPEQTGRMNCSVDYRTDMYSLGVTFYEMLTGKRPFYFQEPMDMIHSHIAKTPDSPSIVNPDIPEVLSDIIMKLMAKSAQDRYQNCLGLASDLGQCLRQWNESGRIYSFELGTKDLSPQFTPPNILMGREVPLAEIYASVDRVCDGAVEVMLVTGEPGIGKSALVNEVRKPIFARRGYYIAGKFDQYQRAIPYSAVIQAFQSLTRQLLAESDEKLKQWNTKLSVTLGQNGKVITDIIPEIELIIGRQPDLPDLGPEETQNRFSIAFKNFVRVFADFNHPLVLFLDDIQWADVASLNLMANIASDKALNSFLFVGAYRITEMSEFHPFMLTSDIIKSAGIPVHTLQLGPLDKQSITEFIATFIHYEHDVIQPLAQAVFEKTKGSPFFVNQFLKTIYEKSFLRIDPYLGWTWDLQKIRDVEATQNVVSFIAGKLHELQSDSLDIIKIASCIGSTFDLETLSIVSKRSMDEIIIIMDNLISEGMLTYVGHLYRFYHDRIQEAAYSLLFAGERENIHYQVGVLDLERTSPDKLSNRIFFICDQLNQSGSRINQDEQRIFFAGLNLKAGIKAKVSAAYSAAASYLKAGCDLLSEESWKNNYDLTYALFIEHMECRYLNRDIAEAERLFSIIIDHATSKVDKGRAYAIMIVLYTSSKTAREAVEFGLEALRVFGVDLDITMGKMAVLTELIKMKYRLKKTGLDNILNLPEMVDEELILIHGLYLNIGLPAYYVNRNLYAVICLKGFNDYVIHGLPVYSGVGCVVTANILQTVFGDYDLAFRLGGVALTLSQRFNDVRNAGMVNHTFGFFISHWNEPIKNNLERYNTSYELSLNSGNLIYAGLSISTLAGIKLSLNHRLGDVLDELNSHREFIGLLNDPLVSAQYNMITRMIRTLMGDIPFDRDFSDNDFNLHAQIDLFREKGNSFGLCYALYYRLLSLLWQKRIDESLKILEELDSLIPYHRGITLEVEHSFIYSLVLIALLKYGISDKPKKHRNLVRRNMKKFMKWANQCPDNFKHKYDLLKADMERLEGNFSEAVEYYHLSISGARAHGYLSNEALACEMAAEFYFERGYQEEGRAFILQAYKAYTTWGATAKAESLKEAHHDIISMNDTHHGMTDSIKETSSSNPIIQNLDFHTVMKVSRVISREIKLDRLLEKTMHMSIANSGAERGHLIFEKGGSLVIQASEDVEKGEIGVLNEIPIENCTSISPAIVNFVYHSGESVILGNAMLDGAFANDPYVVEHQCKSILCVPIRNKGKLTCIFYMENNLAFNAFTDERLEILRVIFAQVAISLQNAMLYEEITSEIAVRKQAEEHMKSSEYKYRTILEELQDIYCETDINGVVTFTNPSACSLTGFTKPELVGSSFRRLFQVGDQKNLEHYYREINETVKAGKPLSCHLLTKKGQTLPLEILTSPIVNKTGDIVGYRNVARDVSERIRLENDLLESSKNVHAARAATILGLAKLAEYRDEETGTHLERIREYSRIITKELAENSDYRGYITEDYVEDIYNSSILHDIGKVGVPDAILLKPGKLTHEEFEIIKTHTTLGGDALRAVENQIQGQTFLTLGKEIAYYHHEKWDGTGYPEGLRGTFIPLSARIVALADVYDALTSKRVYKEAFSHEKAKDIIIQGRGSHFAPDVVDAFIKLEKEFHRIRHELYEEVSLKQEAV